MPPMHVQCHADNSETLARHISRLLANEWKIIPLKRNLPAIDPSIHSTTRTQTQCGVPSHALLECNGKLLAKDISLQFCLLLDILLLDEDSR